MSESGQWRDDDPELTEVARRMWDDPEFDAWRAQVHQAVADGTIYGEPPLKVPRPSA